jgi:hypothetical protein
MDNIHTTTSDIISKQENNECKTVCAHSWSSIYNNFHPIRRLPSITICIVLISLLSFTDFVNTKTTGKTIANKRAQLFVHAHNKTNTSLAKESDNMNQKTFMQITILSNN